MWRWHRRQDSEDRTDEIARMRGQLDGLLNFFASQGALVQSAAPDGVPDVPPALIAAARAGAPRPGGEPVLVTLPDSDEVIAVIGDEGGDPAEWWQAIMRPCRTAAASLSAARGVIHLEHADLPRGLSTLARSDGRTVVITVAASLSAALKRSAVQQAIAAARRAGWLRSRLMPPAVWIPLGAAACWAVARRLIAEAGPAHIAAAAGATATAAVVTVAAVAIATPPRAQPIAPIAKVHRRRSEYELRMKDVAPKPGRKAADPAAADPTPAPASGEVESSAPVPPPPVQVSVSPSPSPSVSASVTPPPGPTCIDVLGVKVCLAA